MKLQFFNNTLETRKGPREGGEGESAGGGEIQYFLDFSVLALFSLYLLKYLVSQGWEPEKNRSWGVDPAVKNYPRMGFWIRVPFFNHWLTPVKKRYR